MGWSRKKALTFCHGQKKIKSFERPNICSMAKKCEMSVALMEKASPKTVFGERVKTGNKIHTELSVMRIIFFIITLKLGIL